MGNEWVYEEIRVESYAGHKGEESPRAFTHRGRRREIVAVLDRWLDAGRDPRAPLDDYFRVRTAEDEVFLIRHTPRFQGWTLCRQAPAPEISDH